jgi:hypothetical protein
MHSGATKVNIGCSPRRAIVKKSDELRKRLVPGRVYRRADLAQWSNAIDRHLQELVKTRTLVEQSWGLYYCPKRTSSGEAPPDRQELVKVFLKDRRFLIIPREAYNPLRLGTLRISKEDTVVYNHKRHGMFVLGGHKYDFMLKPFFPDEITVEFLWVDLVNTVCARRRTKYGQAILDILEEKGGRLDVRRLRNAVQTYGGVRAKKFFKDVLG